jgi:hypothetical protein
MFRSYIPGCAPWFVTPEEARFLSTALEQALDVTPRVKEDPDLLESPDEEKYLVRVQTEKGWEDTWLVPEPFPLHQLPAVDSRRLISIREGLSRHRFTLQADLFAIPSQIKEKGDPRPYLPYVLLVVDADSGMILATDLFVAKPSLDAVWAQAQAGFLGTITRIGSIPRRIAVPDQRLYSLLTPIARGLGSQLHLSQRMPALDEARALLEARM